MALDVDIRVVRDVEDHLGNPVDDSEIVAKPFRWWFRPVRNVERVGEQSAVVFHCEYVRPSAASLSIVGISIRPP